MNWKKNTLQERAWCRQTLQDCMIIKHDQKGFEKFTGSAKVCGLFFLIVLDADWLGRWLCWLLIGWAESHGPSHGKEGSYRWSVSIFQLASKDHQRIDQGAFVWTGSGVNGREQPSLTRIRRRRWVTLFLFITPARKIIRINYNN